MAADFRHLYDRDFAQWALGQAQALREERLSALDRERLATELERMVSRERAEINQRLEALTVQLLMWVVQPAIRTEAFRALIVDQRAAIDNHLRSSPSLRPAIEAAIPRTYAAALDTAAHSGIARDAFPSTPVFSLEQLIDRAFWPSSIFGGRAFSF